LKGIRVVYSIIPVCVLIYNSFASAGSWSAAVRPGRAGSDFGARGPVLFRVTEVGLHQRPWQTFSDTPLYRPPRSRRTSEPRPQAAAEPAEEVTVEETVIIEAPVPLPSSSPEIKKPEQTSTPSPSPQFLPSPPPPPAQPAAAASYGKIPPYFIKNDGQLDPAVRYYVKGPRGTVYLTDTEVVFDFLREIPGEDTEEEEDPGRPDRDREERKEYERLVFRKRFVDPVPDVEVVGEEELPGKINYFVGSRENWRSNIPTVEKIVYRGLYPGIDMEAFFRGGNPVFSYRIHPGSDPSLLKFDYQGVDELRLKPTGELVVVTRFGGFVSPSPRAFQNIEGKEVAVECSFRLRGESGFEYELGPYRSDLPLLIR